MASKANDNHITEQHQYTHQKGNPNCKQFSELDFQNINLHNNIFQR